MTKKPFLKRRRRPESNESGQWSQLLQDLKHRAGTIDAKVARLREQKADIALSAAISMPGKRSDLEDINKLLVKLVIEQEDLAVAIQQAEVKVADSQAYVAARAEHERRVQLKALGEQRVAAAEVIDAKLAELADAVRSYHDVGSAMNRLIKPMTEDRLVRKLFSPQRLQLAIGATLGDVVDVGVRNIRDPRSGMTFAEMERAIVDNQLPPIESPKPEEPITEHDEPDDDGEPRIVRVPFVEPQQPSA